MLKTISISLFVIMMGIAGSAFVQSSNLPKSVTKGKEVYAMYCMNCHMENGKGMTGVFPPLAKSDFLKKPPKALIENILNGQSGEVTVNGVKYNGQMVPHNFLTDEQIADVLNYINNSWGNKSATIFTPAQVKKLRH